MKEWRVIYYEKENGEQPVEIFLHNLNTKIAVKAYHEIMLLQSLGNQLREPYSKSMKDGLFELRIKFANDIARIFYFFYYKKQIILTNGFIKKTQKTPRSEIETALKYKNDFLERQKNEKNQF